MLHEPSLIRANLIRLSALLSVFGPTSSVPCTVMRLPMFLYPVISMQPRLVINRPIGKGAYYRLTQQLITLLCVGN
jgi:hypothetical protein